jgi:phage repressor protein C with HTH and peptisase S24 domain
MTLKLIRIQRLKQLQVERGAAGPAELGKIIGRQGNQTSDLLHGRKSFGEKVARSIEEFAGLPPGWLDDGGDDQTRSGGPSHRKRRASEDSISVPLLGAAGSSEPFMFSLPLALSRNWVNALPSVTDTDNLRLFQVSDGSMQPTFGRGDALLVDIGVRDLTRDGVHLIHAHGRTHVRRLRLRIDGSVEVSEDSPTSRTVEVLPVTRLKITGRVVWAWLSRPAT